MGVEGDSTSDDIALGEEPRGPLIGERDGAGKDPENVHFPWNWSSSIGDLRLQERRPSWSGGKGGFA